jgi:hypothetical protein
LNVLGHEALVSLFEMEFCKQRIHLMNKYLNVFCVSVIGVSRADSVWLLRANYTLKYDLSSNVLSFWLAFVWQIREEHLCA